MQIGKLILITMLWATNYAHANEQASGLMLSLQTLLQEHELIHLVDKEVEATKEQIQVERSEWFPKVSITSQIGLESIDRDIGNDSELAPASAILSIQQKVWDFGKINAAIDRAEKTTLQKQLERNLQEQNLMLAGIEAYLELQKTYKVVGYAKQSESNIKQQAKLEDTRIRSGKGYSADALQAKAELAGAQARRVGAEQALAIARNRFESVFHKAPPLHNQLESLSEPTELLPTNLENIIAALATQNPDVLLNNAAVEIAKAERKVVSTTEWMPTLDIVGESRYLREQDGVRRDRKENEISLRFSWDYDVGGRARHAEKASTKLMVAEQYNADNTLQIAKENAQNAWYELQLTRQRTGYLKDQVDIAGQFLQLARKERELGRRSLIDLLAGETALINAQSDYSAGKADLLVAAYRNIRNVGKLSFNQLFQAQ